MTIAMKTAADGVQKIGDADVGQKIGGADVKDDVSALREDLEKLVSDVARLARQQVRAGAESGGDLKDAIESQIAQTSDRARDYVRENPLGACAMAAAVGFAAAVMMKR
jgi:ElaB/YqjD/DUF883 family membrane-anchored ribosome-binding protein